MAVTLVDSSVFVGIDGGGSSTRALIASLDGKVVGLGQAGPANPNDVGLDASVLALQAAITAAWKDAQKNPQPFAGAFAGVAGAAAFGRSHNVRQLVESMPLVAGAIAEVDHDLRIALAGAFAGAEGIVVIAGTGSASYGRTAAGTSQMAGGFGPLLDDVGSGYWLGVEALRLATKAFDGRATPSVLSKKISATTGASRSAELLEWVKPKRESRPEIAALAPLVFDAAAEGDAAAKLLLQIGARELASLAGAVQRQLFPGCNAPATLIGGLSQNSGYRTAFHEAVEIYSGLRYMTPLYSPVVGAWGLAVWQAGGIPHFDHLPNHVR